MRLTIAATLLAGAVAAAIPAHATAQPARERYARTLARERALRDGTNKVTLRELRSLIGTYERFVRRSPASGYSDNALWQAANVALLAHDRYGEAHDRATAVRLFKQLKAGYPSSSLVRGAREALARLETPATAQLPLPSRSAVLVPAVERTAEMTVPTAARDVVTIREIRRTTLPDGVRVTIEMDGESIYRQERLANPARVFFDLRSARPTAALQDATLRFADDVVREIRLGRHPPSTTRIVMDMRGVESYSAFTLYSPFRLVVDFRRAAGTADSPGLEVSARSVVKPKAVATRGDSLASEPANGTVRLQPDPPVLANLPLEPERSLKTDISLPRPVARTSGQPKTPPIVEKLPLASRPVAPATSVSPSLPSANSNGRFSVARQLGLGISRVVLDPGHGGHDPGARGNGLSEAELVLDVALRLRRLLEKQPGIDVAMTRDSDVFIPLEERTAFANREGADLFLSIHANASGSSKARGVETYFLNFASNPEAQAVAARENSASARTMHNLPDILRAIALNNKIDESRDFAAIVQSALVRRLAARNRQLKDLGVKQAPFVVLIGAGMPSVLAEISFITNKQEGQLLKTAAYRQQIAEALLDAVLRYQQSLKTVRKVATR